MFHFSAASSEENIMETEPSEGKVEKPVSSPPLVGLNDDQVTQIIR